MGTISLTLPVAGTVVAAGLHSSNYTTLQTLANGGIDNNNFAAGRIFDNTKIMQGGALDKQALIWNNGATQWQPAYPPGFEISYAELTTAVLSTTATEAAPLDVVSSGSVTFDGTPVWVEFYADSIVCGGASLAGLSLWEDANDKGRLFDTNGSVVSTGGTFKRKLTPAAGAHTYKVRLWTAGGSNFQVSAGAGGAGTRLPAYLRITKA